MTDMPRDPHSGDETPDPTFRSTTLARSRLNPSEASEYLLTVYGVRIARATLAKLRCIGGGPRFQRFGRSILYPREELDTWALKRLGATLPNTSAGVLDR